MHLSYRLEFEDRGPFADPTRFKRIQDLIVSLSSNFMDKYGTTFLNMYDQNMSLSPYLVPEIRELMDSFPKGILQFGFSTKEALEDKFCLDLPMDHSGYRKQFDNLLDGSKDCVIRVYAVDPITFHDKVEVIYLEQNRELIAEAHTSEDFRLL